MTDPLDALRQPVTPIAPDPAFAAALRRRLAAALSDITQEETVPDIVTRSRNGARRGDISYITLAVPDADRARDFYGSVLGWTFAPGRVDDAHASQVDAVVPQVGLWEDPSGRMGATLGFRVDDIVAAVDAVRAAGGTAEEITEEPYGLASVCTDGQGLSFYLHQLPPPGAPVGANGEMEGDISYIVMSVADWERAAGFFGTVLGWRRETGEHHGGPAVAGMVPMVGLAERAPEVTLCYRVDDIDAAVDRVRAAGGTASAPDRKPYGIESECVDDQGIAFYLHQF